MDGFHHLALRVRDCAASARFYEQVAGLHEIRRAFGEAGELRAVWLGVGPSVLMLETALRGAGPETGSGHVMVFPVPDLSAAEARIACLGLAVDDRTAHTLYLRDPDGHRVGLSAYAFEEP